MPLGYVTQMVPPNMWLKPEGIDWGKILITLLLGIGFLLLQALIVQILWNFVMPKVFGVPCLSFLEALAVTLLIAALFKWIW